LSDDGFLMSLTSSLVIELPMPIWTPRLCIKPRFVGEGAIINAAICASLEHLKPWMPFAQTAPSIVESEEHCRHAVEQFASRQEIILSIYSRDQKQFIGSTGLHEPRWDVPSFEIGYWVSKEFEGQGFVRESTHALTRYAVQVLGAKRVEIRCDSRNTKSLKTMQSLGFVQEGILKNEGLRADGTGLRDTIVTARYDLLGLPELNVSWGNLS
jgi:ribosomal-protein-serine acetyltransferase